MMKSVNAQSCGEDCSHGYAYPQWRPVSLRMLAFATEAANGKSRPMPNR